MAKSANSVTASGDGDVSAFLEKVRAMPATVNSGDRGRLIFAMDATMSRQATWDNALSIQSEMFAETSRIGGLDVQLAYFRGFNECRASKWVSEPKALAKLMTTVDCRGGNTQIAKILAHVKKEISTRKVNAVIYVGDAMEENIDKLCQTAGEIGMQGTPIFAFQEGEDTSAQNAFKEMAKLSRGAYFKLNAQSAHMLRDLLSAVAVYAAGGKSALIAHAKSRGGSSDLLLTQLK
jgi:hypothetical protein